MPGDVSSMGISGDPFNELLTVVRCEEDMLATMPWFLRCWSCFYSIIDLPFCELGELE